MASAVDVEGELTKRLGTLGEVKLQKLLYYCQGWHLAARHRPLFSERVEAWAMGPVVGHHWRRNKSGPTGSTILSAEQLDTIEFVAARYGKFTGPQLVEMTHNEPPWRDVYVPERNREISHSAMADYFSRDPQLSTRGTVVVDTFFDRFEGELTSVEQELLAATLRGERVLDTSNT